MSNQSTYSSVAKGLYDALKRVKDLQRIMYGDGVKTHLGLAALCPIIDEALINYEQSAPLEEKKMKRTQIICAGCLHVLRRKEWDFDDELECKKCGGFDHCFTMREAKEHNMRFYGQAQTPANRRAKV